MCVHGGRHGTRLALHAQAGAAEDRQPDEAKERRPREAPVDHVLHRPPLLPAPPPTVSSFRLQAPDTSRPVSSFRPMILAYRIRLRLAERTRSCWSRNGAAAVQEHACTLHCLVAAGDRAQGVAGAEGTLDMRAIHMPVSGAMHIHQPCRTPHRRHSLSSASRRLRQGGKDEVARRGSRGGRPRRGFRGEEEL